MGRSSVSWVASSGSAGVNFMMKYAKICPFIAVLGLYMMSNSLTYCPLYQSSRGFWFVQYLLHRIFSWDFDGMSLEVRSELSGCSYQR